MTMNDKPERIGPVKSVEEITIYESPDGGKKVYSRKSGSTQRTLILESTDPDHLLRKRWVLWRDILQESTECPALDSLIRQAEMLYEIVQTKE